MSRHKAIRRMIERVIESCGSSSDMREVRSRLEDAARATRRAESKEESSGAASQQRWVFDIGTSSMRNLTRPQMNDALVGIEQMIKKERASLSDSEPKDIITG